MTDFFVTYGIFLAKSLTTVLAILAIFGGIMATVSKGKLRAKEKLEVIDLNEHYQEIKTLMYGEILDKKSLKLFLKKERKNQKTNAEEKNVGRKNSGGNIFAIDFTGDIKASAVENLREAITAVLTIATINDEILINLESPGGTIHCYGLAASQLQRIKERRIPLTVAVDRVAASGGYMMACVADKILAAPFAIIGSIGVIAQLPNFHRFLKKHDVDYEQIMAGEYKRTLSLFGENTDEGREKMQQDVNEAHQLFQNFISAHRATVNIERLATGETWYGIKAQEIGLVDEISTSDDYLLKASENRRIFKVVHSIKKSLGEKLSLSLEQSLARIFNL